VVTDNFPLSACSEESEEKRSTVFFVVDRYLKLDLVGSRDNPQIHLAPGNFSAVSGGIQAASRSHVAPRRPSIASGVLYIHSRNQSQIPVVRLINSWNLKCGF
jgi:hypothetical protein